MELAGQPLEFNDFSGGMTDHAFQGDKRRFAKGDNFLIEVDKSLLERFGTVIFDKVGYSLEGSDSPINRVGTLFTAINESILLGQSGRDFFTFPGVEQPWLKVPTPSGNQALSIGEQYAQVTTGEFQRQVYYTSDAGSLPGKLYRDESNNWTARSVGLPRVKGQPNYSKSFLLARLLAIANSLRGKLISHFKDTDTPPFWPVTATSSGAQHKYLDKWSLSYLEAVTWDPSSAVDPETPGPQPTPTPAGPATDETTLYALCTAMAYAYEHHRVDLAGLAPANGALGKFYYHQNIVLQPNLTGFGAIAANLGINTPLEAKITPSTLAEAASFLDDLTQKTFWHMLSPFSHNPNNDYGVMSRYLPTEGKIGVITDGSPLATPNYNAFIDMAIYMQSAFNQHTNAQSLAVQHVQQDKYSYITLPYPTDFDSAALSIFWCRWLYGYNHIIDASYFYNKVTILFTATAGSANITSVRDATTGTAITLIPGSWISGWTTNFGDALFNDPTNIYNRAAARVLTSASGTATLNKNSAYSVSSGFNSQTLGASWVHGSWQNSLLYSYPTRVTPDSQRVAGGIYGYAKVGTNLQTWLLLAQDFVQAFGAHTVDQISHRVGQTFGGYLNPNGLPLLAGNPFYIPVSASYVYSFFYADRYTVEPNGLEYLTRGNPTVSNLIETCPSYPVNTIITSVDSTIYPDAVIVNRDSCAQITLIPNLKNDAYTNYDTTNVTIEIYRTSDGGTTSYFLDSLPNGTGITQSYLDDTNDTLPAPGESALVTNKPLYTNGGVKGGDAPPKSKFIHFLNGYMYYGGVYDTNGNLLPNRLLQSTQYAPDAVPGANYLDLDDEITCITSSRNILIALCKTSAYRIEGSFDSTGKGYLAAQKISEAMGCLNAKSVVKTEIGTFYAGSDGFYYTDGYQNIKVSIDLDKTYALLTRSEKQKTRIYGVYDKTTRRIFWAMQSSPTMSDTDIVFVYHLDYGVKPSGAFTTIYALYGKSWTPSSLAVFNRELIIGDSRGYIFKQSDDNKTDPLIDYGTNPSTWHQEYIPYLYASCEFDFGTIFKRKWVTKIHFLGENQGNVGMQIETVGDTHLYKNLVPLQYHANFKWSDPNCVWGDPDFIWGVRGDVDAMRRFPMSTMRSDLRQVKFTPAKDITVYRSDSYPEGSQLAEVSAATPTAWADILRTTEHPNLQWPTDMVGMKIYFDTDEYTEGFEIVGYNDDFQRVFFSNPSGLVLPSVGAKWEVRGVRKNQRVKISSFVIHFGYLGDKVSTVEGPSDSNGYGDNS